MTPNPPLPVPSKAAIRALRGLVLGTTCTLALITEDRRRRINAARSAIRNSDRLRSARRYHAGGSAFAIALEEESLAVEPGVIHWNTMPDGGKSRGGKGVSKSRTATPPGLLDWSDAVPPKQRATPTSRRASLLLRDSSSTSPSLGDALAATPSADSHTPTTPSSQQQGVLREDAPQPTAFPFRPPYSLREIQKPEPSLAKRVQDYQSRVRRVDEIASRPAVDIPAATARIVELADAGSAADLEAAVTVLLSTAPLAAKDTATPAGELRTLWEASAALCRACQKVARMDLAQDVLQTAVQCGKLDEAVYFAHNPLPVVRSLIPLDELKAVSSGLVTAAASSRQGAFIRRLRDATALFLPPFSSASRTQSAAELAAVGRELLECEFALGHQKSIRTIYSSILAYPGDIAEFSVWYISQLNQSGRYKMAVRAFLTRPPSSSSLPDSAFFQLGDDVAKAVKQAHYFKAAEVLATLQRLCSVDRRLKTTWVTDILYGEWRKTRHYEQIKSIFTEIAGEDGKVSNTVYFANGAYRVMIQIALEADKPTDAQTYFDDLVSQEPSAEGDIRLLGLFALAKAKQGDWLGVREDFNTAVALAGPKGLPARDAERVFVPIVKEHIRSHTMGETEDFIKTYVEDLGVPLDRQMVTLVANEYGALREVQSFVGWLEYCAKAGFAIDAAFSNAILRSCRKHWNFGFRDLRTLYRKLSVLSPSFEDKATQTIMTHAAISDAKHAGRALQGRILSLRVKSATSSSTKLPVPGNSVLSTGRHMDEDGLYLSMKQAFASGCSAKVVRVYKHAVRDGMPPSEKCLKLAVAAAIRGGGRGKQQVPLPLGASPKAADFDAAIDLLKMAHASGQDIDAAAAQMAVAYIDAVCPRSAASSTWARGGGVGGARRKAGVVAAVHAILAQLSTCGVPMSDLALNRAAFHLFKAGHMGGAVALALSAADKAAKATADRGGRQQPGPSRPGYNVWNFCVLVSAYARLADAQGIRAAVDGATASGVLAGERMAYKVLKQARRRLQSSWEECNANDNRRDSEHARDVQQALQAVEEAVDRARAAREQLRADGRTLEAAAVDIMRRAALDAGCAPVDFDRVPFLKRQAPAATPRAAGPGEEDESSVSSGSSWDVLDLPGPKEYRPDKDAVPASVAAAALVACST